MTKTNKKDATVPEDIYLTVNEVADIMRVSRQLVVKLFKSGAIPATKVGSLWRCRRSAVDAYLSRTT